MLTCNAPVYDYYNGCQEALMGWNGIEQTENLNGTHMLVVLLEEKVLQNEQEISHMQRIIWKLQRENDSFRERIQKLEATVAELWQNNVYWGSNDSGTYSSSDLYEDWDTNDVMDTQNGVYLEQNSTSCSSEASLPEHGAPTSQLYWPTSQPLVCYFYGVPAMQASYINSESSQFNEEDNTANSSHYSPNSYNI